LINDLGFAKWIVDTAIKACKELGAFFNYLPADDG
jgi:hypothetical protein